MSESLHPIGALRKEPEAVRQRSRVFIDMDGVIVDFESAMRAANVVGDVLKKMPGAYLTMPAMPGALAAVRSIIGAGYEVWIATKPPTGIAWAYADKVQWVLDHLPELQRRIIVTHHKGMLGRKGDYLIDDRPHKAFCSEFAGTLIHFNGLGGIGWPEALACLGIGQTASGSGLHARSDDQDERAAQPKKDHP